MAKCHKILLRYQQAVINMVNGRMHKIYIVYKWV